MVDTKVTNQPFTTKVNTFEALLDNVDEDIKKVDASQTASQQPVMEEYIPEYIPVKNNETVEDSTSSTKGSYVRELFKKMWVLFAPSAEKEDSQVTEAKKIDQSLQAIGSRPVLQKPQLGPTSSLNNIVSALKKVEEQQLIKAVDKKEETPERPGFGELSESELEKLTYESHKNQIDIRQKAGVTLKDNIIQDSEDKKRLWKTYLDLLEEARQKSRNSKIFSWIGIGAGVIGGAVFVGGLIALAVGTGGAAIPAILAVAGGVAGLAAGGTGIGGSIFKYQGNQATGGAFVAREKGNLKKDEIMTKIQNMEENDNSITQLWSSLGTLLRNTPSNMFR
jgi:hypothetical protein